MPKNYVKIVITNNIIELMEYEKLNVKGRPTKQALETEKGLGIFKEENYANYQKIRRDTIRRLVTQNFDKNAKFVTLTFANNITDVILANKEYAKFIRRLKTIYPNVKYVTVIEFQKKGRVHYHMISNLPYIAAKELENIWSNGFIKINAIDKVDNLGAYVIKYMTKDHADERLQGLKAYNCSKGLERPTTITTWTDGEDVTKKIFDKYELDKKRPVYLAQYTSKEAGQVIYKQYNLSRNE